MSIRFSVVASSAEAQDEDVLIDAHHISTDREWFEHPIRTHRLRIGHSLHLLAHVALGFKLHRGARDELCINVSHDDPGASHALQLVSVITAAPAGDELPGAITLDEAGDAVECDAVTVRPGGSAPITLLRANVLVIREVPVEVRHG
ncbi:hypothetical protein [Zoogloea sp.]|uniref:hypothetical protein n=1 Tax=Zoogloea sp. TaxID=49181 RepID=UPI00262666FC|nr:hypothetical protein [Zoogloea sp.]